MAQWVKTFYQTWWQDIDPWDLHGRIREPTSANFLLTSTYTCIHIQTPRKQMYKNLTPRYLKIK